LHRNPSTSQPTFAMSNYSDDVDHVSAQQHRHRALGGRAPGVDRLAVMERMFGRPPVDPRHHYGEDVNYNNYDLFDLYKGKNMYLRDTIEGYILDDIEWYTRVIPWLETSDQHIKFNTFQFQTTLATPVPNEGISRLISSNSRTFEDSVQRLGIGFIMEGDLLGTPEGEQQYRRNIAGITQCCQETVNYHTLVALLVCKNYYREMQDLYNEHRLTLDRIEEREAARFAILALSEEGFDRMVVEEQQRIARHRGEADTLIVFPKFPYNEAMVRQGTLTRYYQMGPDGITRFVEGPQSNGNFRGMPIFETREFSVYDNGERAQPLIRDIAVGEYYGMLWGDYRGRMYDGFRTDHRSIYIYDFDDDDFRKISFLSALEHSKTFGGGNNPDALNPATHELARKINSELKQTGAFDKYKDYGDAAKMDTNLVGESNPKRDLYMMLAVDSESARVFPAELIGQLDVNVFTTADLRDAAKTAANRMFGGTRDCLSWCDDVNGVFELVKQWENVAYKADYFTALATKNITQSVDSNGVFVGEKAGVTQWASNAYGGLDLPKWDAKFGTADKTLPAGMANWAGMQTYAAQAVTAGWATEGSVLLKQVRDAVSTVQILAEKMHHLFKHSKALQAEYTAEWFSAKKETELAVFELLYHVRPPIFLRAPRIDEGDSGKLGEDELYKPKFVIPDSNDFLSALPLVNFVDEILKLAGNKKYTAGAKGTLSTYFDALSNNDVDQAEDARRKLTNALYTRVQAHGGDAYTAFYLADQTADYVASKMKLEKDDKVSTDDAEKLAAEIETQTKKLVRDAKRAAKSAGKAEIDKGEKILKANLDSAVKYYKKAKNGDDNNDGDDNDGDSNNLGLDNVPDSIAEAVRATANEKDQNYLEQLRSASEELERLGRKHSSIAAFSWDPAQQQEWAKALVASGKVDKAGIRELHAAFNSHKKALADLRAQINMAASSVQGGDPFASFSDSFANAGKPISQGDNKTNDVYVRAPLTMTQQLLREISKEEDPPIRPADPRSGYRTMFNVWTTKEGKTKAPFGLVQGVLGHAQLAAPDMNKFNARSKSFFHTSYAMSMVALPEVSDAEYGLHAYRAPVGTESLIANDLLNVDFRDSDQINGVPSYETTEDRFARQAAELNERRIAAGLAPRTFETDVVHAARVRREQERAAARQSDIERHRSAMQAKARSADSEFDRMAEDSASGMMSSASAMMARNPLTRFRRMHSAMNAGDDMDDNEEAMAAREREMANKTYEVSVSAKLRKMTKGHFQYRLGKLQDEPDALLRMIENAILLLPNTLTSWRSMAENDVNPLCNILVHRPFIELRMYTCILLQSGYETGFNVIGPSNMAISSTSGDKMIHGSFTFHHATMIVNEKFVSHLRDVYPMGVRAGWGTTPIETPAEIMQGEGRGDWIATMIPITENKIPRRINLINTTDERLMPVTNRSRKTRHMNYSSARWFEMVWNLNEGNINWEVDLHKYHRQSEMINVRLSVGKHWRFDPKDGRFSRLIEGSGQLSQNRTGRGVKAVWLGYADTLFPDQTQITYQLP